jgi:hypothetical protein
VLLMRTTAPSWCVDTQVSDGDIGKTGAAAVVIDCAPRARR